MGEGILKKRKRVITMLQAQRILINVQQDVLRFVPMSVQACKRAEGALSTG